MTSKILDFVKSSNIYACYVWDKGFSLDFNIYAKIAYDYFLELKVDPSLCYELVHPLTTDQDDGCVGVCNGVKLFLSNQMHDYEFLIKI